MEDGAEPRSWLPNGAAPAVVTEDEESADPATPAEDTSVDLDPVTYGENGSYVYEDDASSYEVDLSSGQAEPADAGVIADADVTAPETVAFSPTLAEEDMPSAGTGAIAGYNLHMSPSADEFPPVPPYPAELPEHPITASAPATPRVPVAPRVPAAGLSGAPSSPADRPRRQTGRRANLVLARLEPWSVMKFSFLLSLVAWVVLVVGVALLYYTLSSLGVFSALAKTLSSVTSSQGSGGIDLSKWTSASRVLGYTMLIGAVDVIIITAMSTVGSMIYNLVSHLGGGIEITLKEAD